MKKTNEHQIIKESLDKDVFSEYQYRTRKAEIMEKATKSKANSKKRTYYHFGLSAVAIILFSIVSVSYIMSNQPVPDSPPQAVQTEESRDNNNPVKETEITETEIPLEPKEEDSNEDKEKEEEPLKVQKTEEEWKVYFQNMYNSSPKSIQKLKLVYQYNNASSDNSELEIIANFEGDDFTVKENIISTFNEEITTNHTYISSNDEYIFLDHQRKMYDKESFPPMSAAEWRKDRPLYNGDPLYQFSEGEFEGYKWTEIELNMEENWVMFELMKTDPKMLFYDKGIIKVEYDTGTLLESTTYIAEEISSYYLLKELKINDEVTNLQLDKNIPSEYTSMKEVSSQQERVKIELSWFDQAKAKVIKNHPKIQDIHSTGERDKIFFTIDMKEGATAAEGQKAGQELFDQFTVIANASSSILERDTTIWAEGQYGVDISVRVLNSVLVYGVELDGQITWETKPN